nr:MAG TPA: Minor capsid protein [Caudoviricetes sp.]
MIHIGELITDPDFSQVITVKRRVANVVNHRFVDTPSEFKCAAVITINNPKTLTNDPQFERDEESINVFTNKELYTTGEYNMYKNISDIVYFEGHEYKITSVKNYGKNGFYHSICERMKAT